MGQIYSGLKPFLEQVNELIAQFEASGMATTAELARTNLDNLSRFVSDIPNIAYSKDKTIRVDDRRIPVRVYSPDPQAELPVLVYFHGGGHMAGSIALYDPMCRKLAHAASCVVVSVEYRLAPEYPYPLGLDDCHEAVVNYRQVLDGVHFSDRLFVGGDSAGGSLTASLTARSAVDPGLRFDSQILIYPCVDYTMSFPSMESNGRGFLLESSRISWYFDHYFQQGESREAVSPLFTPLPQTIPSTLLITAGFDPLRDEGYAYADRLRAKGARIEHLNFPDMIHAFMNIEDLVKDQCRRLYRAIGDFVRGVD